MDTKPFLAIILSLMVIIGFQVLKNKMYPQSARPVVKKEVSERSVKKEQPETLKHMPSSQAVIEDIEVMPFVEPKKVTIQTGVTEITLSNLGGKVTDITLNDYLDDKGNKINLINKNFETGKGKTRDEAIKSVLSKLKVSREEAVIEEVEKKSKLLGLFGNDNSIVVKGYRKEGNVENIPVSIYFGNEKLSYRLNTKPYTTDIGTNDLNTITLSEDLPEKTISFVYEDMTGIKIIKKYSFSLNKYKFGLSINLDDKENRYPDSTISVDWKATASSKSLSNSYVGPSLLINNELIQELPDTGEEKVHEGKIDWIGIQNKYFMTAMIPNGNSDYNGFVKNSNSDMISVGFNIGDIDKSNFDIYAGPIQEEILAANSSSLEKVIDYGWFDAVGKPLLKFLKIFYKYTGNYGVAIIILTIIIKIIFYPLSQKSFQSMNKMKKIQPYLNVIKERYKDDPTKLSKETMRLYKENKVNPLGGCFPTLVQIPVFFALYRVLYSAIELRQAHFLFWITDLSLKDPYYITPLLMGASSVIQQKMTPTTADTPQAKMMKFMPVLMTFIFINFPSGLVLYWLVNNVLTIGQQYLINKNS